MEHWKQAETFWQRKFPGGHLQPGSGNQPGLPADARYRERVRFTFNNKGLLESKSAKPESKSLSIQEAWLDKIEHEAVCLGRVPMLGLVIGKQKWIAFPEWAVTPEEEV